MDFLNAESRKIFSVFLDLLPNCKLLFCTILENRQDACSTTQKPALRPVPQLKNRLSGLFHKECIFLWDVGLGILPADQRPNEMCDRLFVR
ncbi:hypothetical protein CP500_001200 [Tychonema bourrellyi FEM_GT703]|uniref:Uncharacterized protein n=1 Tax=Tychonema bourrellyi FEM_GT703 TaxID=2040638 RepID=A0A2G4F6D8_9CYAN|nr:hypothetical protein CP500_001200 [Tychonema bourrellyi FEM_GT703]